MFLKRLFFSSKNSVEGYFLNHGSTQVKFAAVGKGTAEALKKYHCEASYIGEKNNTEDIAIKFKELIKEQTVLYPVGNLSLRSMAEFVDEKQVHFSIVYNTILNPILFDSPFDILIFTSPSNVDSFILKNSITSNQQLIAIGHTTAKHIQRIYPTYNVLVPDTFSEVSILNTLKNIL